MAGPVEIEARLMFALAPPAWHYPPDLKRRQEHALAMHGDMFNTKDVHKYRHQQNDRAIKYMRDPHADPGLWIGDVMLVAHEHAEDEY